VTDRNDRERAVRGDLTVGRLGNVGRARARAVAAALAVFVASVVPVPTGSSTSGGGLLGAVVAALPPGVGLTAPFHFVGYAVVAALLVPVAPRGRQGIALAVTGAVALGFGIELVQAPIPWRSFAWRDVGVNAAGAIVGAAVSAAAEDLRVPTGG
jgi:hypothetical protein